MHPLARFEGHLDDDNKREEETKKEESRRDEFIPGAVKKINCITNHISGVN